jgi:hypothetical protein
MKQHLATDGQDLRLADVINVETKANAKSKEN